VKNGHEEVLEIFEQQIIFSAWWQLFLFDTGQFSESYISSITLQYIQIMIFMHRCMFLVWANLTSFQAFFPFLSVIFIVLILSADTVCMLGVSAHMLIIMIRNRTYSFSG